MLGEADSGGKQRATHAASTRRLLSHCQRDSLWNLDALFFVEFTQQEYIAWLRRAISETTLKCEKTQLNSTQLKLKLKLADATFRDINRKLIEIRKKVGKENPTGSVNGKLASEERAGT